MKHIFTIACLMLCTSVAASQQSELTEKKAPVIKILNAMSQDKDSLRQDSITVNTIPVQAPTNVQAPTTVQVEKKQTAPVAAVPQEKKAEMIVKNDNTFTIDAQVRVRGEYDHGAITPRVAADDAAIFFNERARITLGYERRNMQMRASVQHTGVWGQDAINERNGRVAMSEAWAKGITDNGLFLQVGRQIFSYDDERILGASDWNVAGNSHDALRMGYESAQHQAHLFGSLNQAAEHDHVGNYIGPMPYKNLAGLWYHYQAQKAPVGISLLGLNIGIERTRLGEATGDVKYMQLAGTHFTYCPGDFRIAASFYYQTGTDAKTRKDISAYMASGRAEYNGDIVGGVLAYDYLSGNNGRNTNQHAFKPLYGTVHKFNGSMDYFGQSLECGLQDAQAGLFVNLGRKRPETGRPVTISGNYHYFLTGEKFGEQDWALGHEADFQVSARLMRDLTITAGYSFMLGTATMDYFKGGDHQMWQDWGFITICFNPRILTLKW